MNTYGYPKKTAKANIVTKWPFQVLPYTSSEVLEFCTRDQEWQKFRATLKGVPTFKKLEMLDLRRNANIMANAGKLGVYVDRRHQVQLDNYINALRRGGQLNAQYEAVK